MSYGHNQVITATDFNTYLSEIIRNYSVGSGDRGYGQPDLNVTSVHVGQEPITAQHWLRLGSMLTICAQQTGTSIAGLELDPMVYEKITVGNAIQPALLLIDNNRLSPALSATSLYSAVNTIAMTSTWNGLLEATITFDFGSEDAARYFFNSGGDLRLTFSHPNGTDNLNNSWRTLVQDTIGTVIIGSNSVRTQSTINTGNFGTGYYSLTDLKQVVINQANTGFNYSSGAVDNVQISLSRGNSTGINGGNGSLVSVYVRMQCEGTSTGGTLSAGMKIRVDLTKADKFLAGIVTPTVASTGFNIIRVGNHGADTPPDTGTPGTPNKATYPAGSTRTFVVPQYSTITFNLQGAGGAEGSSLGPQPRPTGAKALFSPVGAAGKDATVAALGLVAYGGGGGGVYNLTARLPGPPGAPGGASGGDTNTSGGGAAGGRDRYVTETTWSNGSPGGAGGRCLRTYLRGSTGAPQIGQTLIVVTPDGGYSDDLTPSAGGSYDFYPGNPGAAGNVEITWTNTTAGSVSYHTPGNYAFAVPDYTTIKFTLSGGGGGQSGSGSGVWLGPQGIWIQTWAGTDGATGGQSTITGISGWTPVSFGGNGGMLVAVGPGQWQQHRGDDGVAFGDPSRVKGGGAKGGALGFKRRWGADDPREGGPGGDAGLIEKTFARTDAGAPQPGSTLQLTVGAGGASGLWYVSPPILTDPGNTWSDSGQDGWIIIEWT